MMRIASGVPGLAVLAILYVLVPGHPELPAGGIPVGALGTVVLSLLVFLAVFYRRVTLERREIVRVAAILGVLAVSKVMLGAGIERRGWTARYFANDQWAGSPQWSSDFRLPDATRIDATIAFDERSFPIHHLNDLQFDRRDFRRENVQPMSVDWSGVVSLDRERREEFSLTARGTGRVSVDGREVLSFMSPADGPVSASRTVDLAAGGHLLSVRYAKPANAAGAIELRPVGAGALSVSPRPDGKLSSPARLGAAAAVHVMFLCVVTWIFWLGERRTAAELKLGNGLRAIGDATMRLLAVVVTILFGVQGFVLARGMIGRATVLTGGDDWFYYEAGARDILHGDLLMRFGAAPGLGRPFDVYPLYSYLLALVHRVCGEDLFAPVFLQFLVLAVVTMLVCRLIVRLLDPVAALFGALALVALFELDFTRYYTVTLLSENVYILTVTVTLLALVRWTQTHTRRDLLWAALWGGVSSVTRPAMMTFLIPMLAFVAFVSLRRANGVGRTLWDLTLVAAIWMAVMAPATWRNYVVSGHPVLIAGGLGESFVKFNLPPAVDPQPYRAMFTGGIASSFAVLIRLFREHPIDMLRVQLDKLSFSLGMVQTHQGYRLHPELVAATVVYAAIFLGWRPMRAPAMWPIHLFVLAHLAAMGLTQPWTYGYRLILPPFVYTSALSAGALATLALSRTPRRTAHAAAGS